MKNVSDDFSPSRDIMKRYANIFRLFRYIGRVLSEIANVSKTSNYPKIKEVGDSNSPVLDFMEQYAKIHGYVASVICAFGIISNVLNIIVLSKKNVIGPTSCILIALAVADIFVIVSYMVYLIDRALISETFTNTLEWVYFFVCADFVSVASYNNIVWLTVSLAIFQYISVRFPLKSSTYCSMKRAKITIFIAFIATVALTIPITFQLEVASLRQYSESNNSTYYYTTVTTNRTLWWIYGVSMKVVPGVLLSILSVAIIHKVRQANQRRLNILGTQDSRQRSNIETNQMTYMLVAIMALFVLTQLPHGVLLMISGLDVQFFYSVYSKAGDFLDLLSLINSSMIFVIYCSMSKKFRTTFYMLFARLIKLLRHICQNNDKQSTTTSVV